MNNQQTWPKFVGTLVFLAALVWGVFVVIAAIQLSKNTGLLQVNLVYKNVPISVGAEGKAPQFIGKDSPVVRLQPGTYTVAAIVKGDEIVAQANVVAGQTTTVKLNPAQAITIPSADNVNFSGLDSLTDIGLTSQQIGLLKYQLFAVKPTASNIVIDTSSIITAPYNPESSAGFGVSFDFSDDGKYYHAKLSYQGLSDLGVIITDSNGKTVSSVPDKSPF